MESVLTKEKQQNWIFYEEEVKDALNWLPLCDYVDGIRFHVLYRNEITNACKYMIVWINTGDHEISDLTEEEAKHKYDWIIGGRNLNSNKKDDDKFNK
ncbi:MAG: hypothetical protein Terrestrivirus8_51 [Terrestrivirus sp.]|uniref:Uncharacterized protein n=1 Tax=Terrestrivirus sp. TaxID=2487775 RepID=A0A3G4ZNW8_9VIRU|nr:MAG: hypothetical protein Terrestrivirus8_51 [Terrestrivirus sp.]